MQVKQFMGSTVTSLINLFFPNACAGCNQPLSIGEDIMCNRCLAKLPLTWYHLSAENPVEKMFTGRAQVEAAAACFFFHRESIVQNIIHQFKYQDRTDIARYMGKQMGLLLSESPLFNRVDALIPVPLPALKEKKRGYNQSKLLCEGMREVLDLPVYSGMLRRSFAAADYPPQWDTGNGQKQPVFSTEKTILLAHKHVLLVDDVITTGETLAACAGCLKQIPDVKISILGLAVASF